MSAFGDFTPDWTVERHLGLSPGDMLKTLSAPEVAALSEDGDHYVDHNLWLQIRDGGKTARYRANVADAT